LARFGLRQSLNQVDVTSLLDWVEQGNTLMICGTANAQLLGKLGVVITHDKDSGDTIFKAAPGAVGGYTSRVDRIGLESASTVYGRKGVPLWSIGSKAGALAVRHGAGRVLVIADPSVFTHRGLLREDNALFLYNVAALDAEGGEVYFEEYHHGIRSGSGYWNYLRYHDQHWGFLHLVLVAVVAMWAVARRLGPATPLVTTGRTDGVDYATSVARIYEKADAGPLVAGIYALNFLDSLTTHLRLRRSAESSEIIGAWRLRYGDQSAQKLRQWLDDAQSMITGEGITTASTLSAARRFDAFLDQTLPRTKARLAAAALA
jgi:hypothetical protein